MNRKFSIKELINFFSPPQNSFTNYFQYLTPQAKQLNNQQNPLELVDENFTKLATPSLLKFIICTKLVTLNKEMNKNLSLQFTRRTKLKQQKNRREFEDLSEAIQAKYHTFGNKILQWIQTEFITPQLNKVIVDRLPEDKFKDQQINFRITFYHQNHPQDLNLKITNQVNNLKQIAVSDLLTYLSRINKLDLTDYNLLNSSSRDILSYLQQTLAKVNKKKAIHKLFKCLLGSKPYYLIIAHENPIIADLTKLSLPDTFNLTQEDDKLVASFNNHYHLQAEIIYKDQTPYLAIDFQSLPDELKLFSF
jgi:hypothetical protein